MYTDMQNEAAEQRGWSRMGCGCRSNGTIGGIVGRGCLFQLCKHMSLPVKIENSQLASVALHHSIEHSIEHSTAFFVLSLASNRRSVSPAHFFHTSFIAETRLLGLLGIDPLPRPPPAFTGMQ